MSSQFVLLSHCVSPSPNDQLFHNHLLGICDLDKIDAGSGMVEGDIEPQFARVQRGVNIPAQTVQLIPVHTAPVILADAVPA
jgi:hypothetical protein